MPSLMTSRDEIELLSSKLQTVEELARAITGFEADFPFEYAMVGDCLRSLLKTRSAEGQRAAEKHLKKTLRVIRKRLNSLENWSQQDNQTVAAIREGEIDPCTIKPHVRAPQEVYERFYREQEAAFAAKERNLLEGRWAEQRYRRMQLGRNVNHAFRKVHAVNVMEALFGLIWMRRNDRPIRWLDVACGMGQLTSGVDPQRYGAKTWEIVGCDFQTAKIEYAQARRARGRTFIAIDAFELLERARHERSVYDIVSMFEFLEHLDDPLAFLQRLKVFQPEYVVAASPLAQKIDKPREADVDPIHFWSFSRPSFEKMFELAGFQIVYSSEVRVGQYVGGMDWLTIICGPWKFLHKKREALK